MSNPKTQSTHPGTVPETPTTRSAAEVRQAITHAANRAREKYSDDYCPDAGRVVLAAVGQLEPRHLRMARELGDAICEGLPPKDGGVESALHGPGDARSDGRELFGVVFGAAYILASRGTSALCSP